MLDWLFGLEARRRRLAERTRAGPLKDFLSAPFPSGRLSCTEAEFVAIDLETTSLDPRRGEILSVGHVLIEQRCIRVATAQHRLIRPAGPIPERSVVIHGITDQMAAEGEVERDVLADLLELLRGRVLVAHHARLDLGFIDAACQRHFGGRFLCPAVDTLRLARRRLEQRGRVLRHGELRLDALRRSFHLPRYRAHNALTDAIGAAELFLADWAYRESSHPLRLNDVLMGRT